MFEYNKISCSILTHLAYIVISNEDTIYVVVEFLKGISIKKKTNTTIARQQPLINN